MEDGFYICTWQKIKNDYKCWIKNRSDVSGSGKTIDEASLALLDAIQEKFGTIRVILEFDPPLPQTDLEQRFTKPEIFIAGYDGIFDNNAQKRTPFETVEEKEARMEIEDTYYDKPICRTCNYSSSPRSKKQITVTSIESKYNCLGGRVADSCLNTVHLFSEDFISLLTKDEKKRLIFQPIQQNKRYKKKYFELIGPEGPDAVAINGLKASGWKCNTCNRISFGYWVPDFNIHHFIAKSDLPNPLPSIFTIGKAPDI